MSVLALMSPPNLNVDISLELRRSKVQKRREMEIVIINMEKEAFFLLGSLLANCKTANKGCNREHPEKDNPAVNWKLKTV